MAYLFFIKNNTERYIKIILKGITIKKGIIMINDKVELNFEITLRKNKRKIKIECTTNRYNTISTDIYIDTKPMHVHPDDLLREQLEDFGFNESEIETFVLLKNYLCLHT